MYATLGSALADGGSDSEEAETEPTESNHPYAKGKFKRNNLFGFFLLQFLCFSVRKVRDHPYATVVQSDVIPNSGGAASLIHSRAPEDIVDTNQEDI